MKGDYVIAARKPFVPDWASPPGDTLAELLEERSMTQTELAERLGVSLKHVNRIIKGAAIDFCRTSARPREGLWRTGFLLDDAGGAFPV